MTSDSRSMGVTPPLSTSLPTEAEKKANEALIEELRRQNNFESAAETEKRKEVLKQIENIGHEFVRRVAQRKEGHNQRLIKDAICRVFTYGSYRLGVHSPGSDIDTLVIGPKYCFIEDFFLFMPSCLRELSPPGAITSMAEVPDAFVPIIKLVYSGIEIDLIFTRMATLKQLPSDPGWNMQDPNLLRGLGDTEVRAINGTRVNDEIITLVPEPSTFRLALRAIKLWAQNRAVYGNIVGFPGGIAWALMVARVCQLLPKAPSSVVVSKFFGIMLQWPYPQPVILKEVETGNLQLPIWNPKGSKRDGTALMPIITPAYPSMNSTYNISPSTFSIIMSELERGSKISAEIMDGNRSWKNLFEKHTFFTKDYKYYMAFTTLGMNKEDLKTWSGWVESRLRLMVQALERHHAIVQCHPFIKGYFRKHRCLKDADTAQVADRSMEFTVKEGDSEDASDKETPKQEKSPKEVIPEEALKKEEGSEETPKKEEAPEKKLKKEQGSEETPTTENCRQKEGDKPKPAERQDGTNGSADAEAGAASSENGVTEAVKAESGDDETRKPGFDVFTKTFYMGLELSANVGKGQGLDMEHPVQLFKKKCEDWAPYTSQLHLTCSLSIGVIRSINLPDDVFDPGEVKPTKPKKAKKTGVKKGASTNGAGKKRLAATPNESPRPAKRANVATG